MQDASTILSYRSVPLWFCLELASICFSEKVVCMAGRTEIHKWKLRCFDSDAIPHARLGIPDGAVALHTCTSPRSFATPTSVTSPRLQSL